MKKMADLELCAAISDAFGPSGYEKEAVDVIESSLGGLAAHRDSMQNLYVSLPQNVGGRPLVMLDAHTDEVGFMVQSITATGLLRIVPLAALNSGVLGTVLVERTQSFTLGQSLGFGLGSGLGYVLAVLLVTEARHRLRSKAIPKAFRGLPITLVYIGVLALAIYGFTGHSVIL